MNDVTEVDGHVPGEQAAREWVDIGAPAHDVWALRLDFSRLPEYNSAVSEVVQATAPGPDGAGATWRFQLKTPAGLHPVTLTVTEVVADVLVAATMTGQLQAHERFEITAGEGAGSRATLTLWLELPPTCRGR